VKSAPDPLGNQNWQQRRSEKSKKLTAEAQKKLRTQRTNARTMNSPETFLAISAISAVVRINQKPKPRRGDRKIAGGERSLQRRWIEQPVTGQPFALPSPKGMNNKAQGWRVFCANPGKMWMRVPTLKGLEMF
jgi:hypothetical protein